MLTWNEAQKTFVLFSNDARKAVDVGMTEHITVRGPNGEKCWSTDTAYAALSYWDEADARAKGKLERLHAHYESSFAKDMDRRFPAPADRELYPFQRAGVHYALSRAHALIGDSPGLGKTAQAISYCNELRSEKNLIVVPASLRLQWAKNIAEWTTLRFKHGRMPSIEAILNTRQGVPQVPNFVVTSYDALRNEGHHRALMQTNWDVMVLDEAHYCKTIDAKRTRAVFGQHGGKGYFRESYLTQKAQRVLALTGTPLLNRPREAYTLARGLCWESIDFRSEDDFAYRFNPPKLMGDTVEVKGRLPELQARLRCNFMVRRLKEDVAKDLPDKVYELSYIEPDSALRDILARESRFHHIPVESLLDPSSEIAGQISTIRREMGEAKVPGVVLHIRELLDGMEIPKIVVFAHHVSVMDALTMKLASYGVASVRGGMGPNRKQAEVDRFIREKNVRIFLGQMDSAGFGVDGLQKVCSHVVFAEAAWTPGTNDQALDRCHRIGQHDNVIGQFLVVEGSIDERILYAVVKKAKAINTSLDARLFA